MGDAEKLKSATAFVRVFQGFEFRRLTKVGEFIPHFELFEGGKKTTVAVESASASLGEGVVFGVPGERNHVSGKGGLRTKNMTSSEDGNCHGRTDG